jgi:hypothetical protein
MKQVSTQLINRITEDFHYGVQYSKKYRLLIFFSFLLTFFVVALLHNLHLFTTVIFESGDYAANSILINLAKTLQLFVGNSSRMGFSHPGPAFSYVMAIFEKILFDGFHLVPSAFNAHVIGIMFLNAFFLALCSYIFFDFTKSVIKTLSVVALVLFFYSLNPVLLYSTWMPHAYFAPFFAFILSASAVSAKRSYFIWVMVLSGLFLIHGHVAFILIICPVSLISLILCMSKYEFNINRFVDDNRFTIGISVIIILIFLSPILINTVINYPGEFGKYFQYSSNSVQQMPSIYSIMEFFLPFWSIVVTSVQFPSNLPIQTSGAFAGFVSLLLICSAIILVYNYTLEKKIKDIIKSTGIIIFTVSTLFLIYIAKGIDELSALNHYTGIFFYAVPLLLLCLILIGVISKISNYKIITLILIISLITIGIIASLGNFTDPERGSQYTKDIIKKLQSDTRWSNDTIVLDFPHDYWLEVAGIVLASERLGKPIYVNPFWEFMFTKNHMLENNPDPSKKMWHIELTDKKDVAQNVIYSNQVFSLIDNPNLTINTGNGWYANENWGGGSYRWMNKNGELYIFSPDYCKSDLILEVMSFYHPRKLIISMNNTMIYQGEIPSSKFLNISVPITLVPGQNKINLFIPTGSEKPSDIIELHNNDQRNLSIVFSLNSGSIREYGVI